VRSSSTGTTVIFHDESWNRRTTVEFTKFVSDNRDIDNHLSLTTDVNILNVVLKDVSVVIDVIVERVLTDTESVEEFVDHNVHVLLVFKDITVG